MVRRRERRKKREVRPLRGPKLAVPLIWDNGEVGKGGGTVPLLCVRARRGTESTFTIEINISAKSLSPAISGLERERGEATASKEEKKVSSPCPAVQKALLYLERLIFGREEKRKDLVLLTKNGARRRKNRGRIHSLPSAIQYLPKSREKGMKTACESSRVLSLPRLLLYSIPVDRQICKFTLALFPPPPHVFILCYSESLV